MDLDYTYCPYCGTELDERYVFGSVRKVCRTCNFVQFHDPKVAVIGLVTSGRHVLLVRRGVEPAKGKWALPGGYMDAGEMPEKALTRELEEEVGLQLDAGRLLGIYPFAKTSRIAGGIVIAYHVELPSKSLPTVRHFDDVDEAGWFEANELPECVAFESSRQLLRRWLKNEL